MTKENRQKGLTIVELVVVIGIMVVMLAAIGISLNTIFYNKTKAAARNIYNMLGTAQTLGMSKNNVYFGIENTTDGYNVFVATSTDGGNTYTKIEEKSLGNKMEINAYGSGWSMSFAVGNGGVGAFLIPIDRTTGGFKNTITHIAGPHETSPCTSIKVGTGSNQYTIILVPQTGKFYYE